MTNFLNALEVGIQSALNRESNFIEIHELFIDLKNNLDNFTDGKVSYHLESKTLLGQPKDYFEDPSNIYMDKSFVLVHKENKIKLTEVYFDRENGYPCVITIGGNEYGSSNRDSLESNLKKLLSSPNIGQIFYSIQKE